MWNTETKVSLAFQCLPQYLLQENKRIFNGCEVQIENFVTMWQSLSSWCQTVILSNRIFKLYQATTIELFFLHHFIHLCIKIMIFSQETDGSPLSGTFGGKWRQNWCQKKSENDVKLVVSYPLVLYYKNLKWLWVADWNFCHKGNCSASRGLQFTPNNHYRFFSLHTLPSTIVFFFKSLNMHYFYAEITTCSIKKCLVRLLYKNALHKVVLHPLV